MRTFKWHSQMSALRVWGVSNPRAIDHAERAELCDLTGQMRGGPGTGGPWGPGASAGASFCHFGTHQDPWPSCSQLIGSDRDRP
jgi:hypothetical protein